MVRLTKAIGFIKSTHHIAAVKPEKCCYCGDMTDMPFECTYCKDPFCPEHRLPEEHRCVKLTQIRAGRFGKKGVIRDGGRKGGGFFKKVFKRLKD